MGDRISRSMTRSPEFYDGLVIPHGCVDFPRAWLVVPLIMHERLLGFVLLAQLEGQNQAQLGGQRPAEDCRPPGGELPGPVEAANALMVARQFESFNRMSTFVVHDLKNLVSQLSLLISNAEKHKHNPEFQQDMIETVNHSVQKMKRLLLQLRRGYTPEPPAPCRRRRGAPARSRSGASSQHRCFESLEPWPERAGRPRAARARGRPPDPERHRSDAQGRQGEVQLPRQSGRR